MFSWLKTIALPVTLVFAASAWAEDPPAESESEERELKDLPVVNEAFTYQIRWGILTVGEATLGMRGPVEWNGQPAYHIYHTARTTGLVDSFYRVRNRVDSFIHPSGERSLHYSKIQREGKSERDVIVFFDWENQTAQYTNRDQISEPVAIGPNTHDPISVVFAARHLPFEEGKTMTIPVSDGRNYFQAELTIADRKRIRTKVGTFDAVLVSADTKNLGGVFEKSRETDIQFWVSNDSRRLPLLMLSSVSIGKFRAELVALEARDPDLPPFED